MRFPRILFKRIETLLETCVLGTEVGKPTIFSGYLSPEAP
jgi:hypothetical protein